jgi:hypothetical protein
MKSKKKIILLILFIICAALFLGFRSYTFKNGPGSASLSWGANTESDLAGYKIYYGTSSRTADCPKGGYAKMIDVGKKTKYILTNLDPGKTYYFSITSYNGSGKESCFSEEMKKTIAGSKWDWVKNVFKKK